MNDFDRLNEVCTCSDDKGKFINLIKDEQLRLVHVQCSDCLEFIVVNFDDKVNIKERK